MDFKESKNNNLAEKVLLYPGDSLSLESGTYEVINDIGSGGFGTVYHIRDKKNQEFALKVLELWKTNSSEEKEEISKRFAKEFDSGRIKSDYIVRSYYFGHMRGNPYIIMEYCPHGNLREKMDLYKKESSFEQIAIDILKGLSHLHQEGIIHRDLKPSNILLDVNHQVKLADFGISGYLSSRLTQVSASGFVKNLWATMAYSPPEQLDKERAFSLMGPLTDTFAFGVVSYEILTGGYHPFGTINQLKNDRSAFLERVRKGRWVNIKQYCPDLSKRWIKIIKGCLNPDPEKRIKDPISILEKIGVKTDELKTELAPSNKIFSKASKPQRGKQLRDSRSPSTSSEKKLCLKIVNGSSAGKVFDLNQLIQEKSRNFLTIGRLNRNSKYISDIAIEDVTPSYISTRHATLEYLRGNWYIRDGQWIRKEGQSEWLKSTNGTAINYKQIPSEKQTRLDVGDIISVGDITLKVEVLNFS